MDEEPVTINGGPWNSGQRLPEPVELAAGLQRRMNESPSKQMVPESFPEEWGGRPTGSSRRAIRMQEEWDKKRERQIDEAKAFQEMDIQRKQFEMQARDQQFQEDEFYYNRGLKEAEQKLQAQQRSEAAAIIGGLNQLDPRSPDYQKNVATLFGQNPLGATDEGVQKVWGQYGAASEIYNNSLVTQSEQQKKDEEVFFKTQQSLLESGVPEEKLSKYYDANAPAGVIRFDQNAVSKQIGTTKFAEKQATAEKKEETPKDKINLDLQQAYGELNELLLSGADDTDSARAKVAGLRERYKSAIGENAPEVFPSPSNREQYDRLPSGTSYIGKDGKIKIKQ
jgi:hypothetical protein